jgi:membrane protein implicated in regulation of membrane protease activity
MIDGAMRRPTLQLLGELVEQLRLLFEAELSLARAELTESATSLRAGAAALAGGLALMFAGLFVLLIAAGLLLTRLRIPPDLAFLLVAVAAFVVAWLLLRLAARRLNAERLMPTRSLSQVSSLLGRRN